MRARAFALTVVSSLLWLAATSARADMVVVANPHSGVERLNRDELVNIFLGRYRMLASGIAAEPLDREGDSPMRAEFYHKLVGKSLAEINSYWARLVFSGKTHPPQVVASGEEALRIVASRVGALTYLERERADRRVVIVFEFGE